MFGLKRDKMTGSRRKLRVEEIRYLCSSHHILRINK